MTCRAKLSARWLVGFGLLLVLVACGSSSGGATSGSQGVSQGPAQEVKIDMGDFFYKPSEIRVKTGRVRFTLTNIGQTAHRFAVTAEGGFSQSSKNVAAGKEAVWEVDLESGTYKMGCSLGDHEARGAVGKLTVSQ